MQLVGITTTITQEQQIKDRINISLRSKVMMEGKHWIHLVNSSNQKITITIITMEATIKERTIITKEIIATIKGIHTTITDSKVEITILIKALLETTWERSHSRTRKAWVEVMMMVISRLERLKKKDHIDHKQEEITISRKREITTITTTTMGMMAMHHHHRRTFSRRNTKIEVWLKIAKSKTEGSFFE